jgi:hypothetical protein
LEAGSAEVVVAGAVAEEAEAEETWLGIIGLLAVEALVMVEVEAMATARPATVPMVLVAAVLVGTAEVEVEVPSRGGKPFTTHTFAPTKSTWSIPRDNPLVFPDLRLELPYMRSFPKISRKVPKKHTV